MARRLNEGEALVEVGVMGLRGPGNRAREQTTLRLPAALTEALKRQAQAKCISLNALLLMILNEARNLQEK